MTRDVIISKEYMLLEINQNGYAGQFERNWLKQNKFSHFTFVFDY